MQTKINKQTSIREILSYSEHKQNIRGNQNIYKKDEGYTQNKN